MAISGANDYFVKLCDFDNILVFFQLFNGIPISHKLLWIEWKNKILKKCNHQSFKYDSLKNLFP